MWNRFIAWLSRAPFVEARVKLTNERDVAVNFFIEPWAEQFEALAGETVEFVATRRAEIGEFECVPEEDCAMRVYALGGSTVRILSPRGEFSAGLACSRVAPPDNPPGVSTREVMTAYFGEVGNPP